MAKKWAFSQTNSGSPGFFVKRCLMRPFHVALIVVGLVLIFSAAQLHAFSTVSVSLSAHELSMQPGTELPLVVRVDTPFGKSTSVSFDVEYPSALRVDGELSPIVTSFPLERNFHVAANWNAPQGDYEITFRVHTQGEGQSFIDTQTIRVHVGEKGQVAYLTSPNTTLSPVISIVVFSTNEVSVGRNENASVSISFSNSGSATDYLVRLSEPSLNVPVHIVNEMHRFVENGESVTSFIEIATTPTTPFGTHSLRVEAYNLVSGEKTFLGTVIVRVVKFINVDASIPFHSFVIEEKSFVNSSITLTNTEYSDADVLVETSSSLVEVPLRNVHVPAKSSLSVPVIIHASPSLGVRSDLVYVLNADLTEQVSFSVETVKQGTLASVEIPDENTPNNSPSSISGLVVSAFSSWVGIVLVVLAGLIIFSAKFRDRMLSYLPKPIPPAKNKVDAKPRVEKLSAQDTTTIVSPAPASNESVKSPEIKK
jgi:hypothetical protein